MTDVYSVLDVGAEKICCLIAVREPGRTLTVIGSGHTRSEGFDNGVVTDMYALPTAIRKAVRRAEEMADGRITQVIATLPCAQPTRRTRNFPPFQIMGGHGAEFQRKRLDDPERRTIRGQAGCPRHCPSDMSWTEAGWTIRRQVGNLLRSRAPRACRTALSGTRDVLAAPRSSQGLCSGTAADSPS